MAPRPRHEMPDPVREALERCRLRDAYDARPPYQRDDDLGWIGRKTDATRARRIGQMLDELRDGSTTMGMAWTAGEG